MAKDRFEAAVVEYQGTSESTGQYPTRCTCCCAGGSRSACTLWDILPMEFLMLVMLWGCGCGEEDLNSNETVGCTG